MDYEAFVAKKLTRDPPTGLAAVPTLHASLYPHQQDLVGWSLRRGRAAIFADTGLGKTACEIEWARHVANHTEGRVLILAPLAVAAQTAREGDRMGIPVKVCREMADVDGALSVTNYDRLHKFDPSAFAGVVLDESSCIKHADTATLRLLIAAFSETPFRLCATATPAPNDWTELGTHAEFLGVCSRAEMLAEFFCHDGGETQTWRLKGHARQAFWRFVASWGALVRKPSDLGHSDADYELPPLVVESKTIPANAATVRGMGLLFGEEAKTLSDRRSARRASIEGRVSVCAEDVRASWDRVGVEPWLIWCDLNAEQDALEEEFGHLAFSVRGADSIDEKENSILRWIAGERPVMISKPSIMGFGLNFQHCARQSFVGVTDSWEQYYQAVRRSWRFGQRRTVYAGIYASEAEGAVVQNLARKERDARAMADALSRETADAVRAEVSGLTRETNDYNPTRPIRVPSWLRSEDCP
jgi:hypothetical protein